MKIGQTFGEWTVLEMLNRASRVLARCSCGTEKEVRTAALATGASRGCMACTKSRPRVRHPSIPAGARVGAWLVGDRVPETTPARRVCTCDCGAVHHVTESNLRSRQSQGCQTCAWERGKSRTHGMTGSKEYAAWTAMIARCGEHYIAHEHYADRGISVCAEWRGPGGFEAFHQHIGPAPTPKHSVDRINNDDGYRPGNVRWATQREQMRNTRRSRLIPLGGQMFTMEEAGARLGITRQGIHERLKH
jgi:hypothetical protein